MNYVYAGYGATFAVLALYAVRVVLRGRALRRALGQAGPAGEARRAEVGGGVHAGGDRRQDREQPWMAATGEQ